ncbi:MAG: hypothetical protein IJW29_08315 [Clostridia bacterium]|nr:hypothetical protein [Clostridia bacterium]
MAYGYIDFEHVWKYQIGCMMANQFSSLVQAIYNNNADEVIVSCLRLGWNDAFKHVSENTNSFNALSDTSKNQAVQGACVKLVKYFKTYAEKTNFSDRYDTIDQFIKNACFVSIFSSIKNTTSTTYPLCLGHIQKMFNIAIKLLLCLIISAEHATACGLKVKLGEQDGHDVDLTSHNLLSFSNFPYAFDTADCPIDHLILVEIQEKKTTPHSTVFDNPRYDKIVWSKMGDLSNGAKEDQQNYKAAQKEIENIQSGTGKSNLCFDFENWK